jgi:hypothetical protein
MKPSVIKVNHRQGKPGQRTLPGVNPISSEASVLWERTLTPLYTEFMSQRKSTPGQRSNYNEDLTHDETLFWTYVTRLKEKYPACKVDVDPRGPYGLRTGNTSQPFLTSAGENYYAQFKRAEKACELTKSLSPMISVGVPQRRGMPKKRQEAFEIKTLQDLQRYLEEKEKETQNAERQREEAERRRRNQAADEERRRFAAVRQGNLLGLNAPPEPNLLSFEPTKEMVNARMGELSEVFSNKKGGKRKTRKGKRGMRKGTRRH